MLIVIDNYDSFTYNLVQYLGELGAELSVYRNDAITPDEVERLAPAGIVVSPGPGTPRDAGVSIPVIRRFAERIPILGVCLGHQAIGEVFGGVVERGPVPVHGKTAWIYHDGRGVFTGLPNPFEATRYHSLVVRRADLPACLEVSAESGDRLVMGLRHRELPVEGVQFHPESILTVPGKALLGNFLARLGPQAPAASGAAPDRDLRRFE
jgi:anthranilate synthase/aminodeoxychorismate synthase-like glutamine amidotransferase